MPASAARPRATASKSSFATANYTTQLKRLKELQGLQRRTFSLCNVVTLLTSSIICAMLDIRLVREKPDFVRERLATRGGGDEAKIDEVLRVDAERRKTETELQRSQSERNRLSKEIGGKRS